jgi:prolyl oligopeptidase
VLAPWGIHAGDHAKPHSLVYPVAEKCSQSDIYHGITVKDEYRWLEDANSSKTKAWVKAENELVADYFKEIPERELIVARLLELSREPSSGEPIKLGDHFFVGRRDSGQNQNVLYTMPSLESKPSVLLDPNTMSKDGTILLRKYSISHDGRYLAYGVSKAGAHGENWHVREVESGRDLPELFEVAQFGNSPWSPGNRGFFYNSWCYPVRGDTNYLYGLYQHKLGSRKATDTLIYSNPKHKMWYYDGSVTEDGRYLIITVQDGSYTRNGIYYKNLRDDKNPVVQLLTGFDAAYQFIGNVGNLFYFRTDAKAPHGRLIGIDISQPDEKHWQETLPPGDNVLSQALLVGTRLVTVYLKDARSEIKLFNLDGTAQGKIELPGVGSAFLSKQEGHEHDCLYTFVSFTRPATIYRYDFDTATSTELRHYKTDFDSERFETEQVFYPGKDGTRIPMFVAHKKGMKLDGKNPTMLSGYGGFGISQTPSFTLGRAVWMEMGGIYALANIRGGYEYGEQWHAAGTKLKKQQVFDDFIAAAEWLITNHYTSSDKLGIEGKSNGGLLVGACLTQRPDLFAAAVPVIGVMDMVRFQKLSRNAWVDEYGSVENAEEFKALYAYSPLHHVHSCTHYPATFIITGDHDDVVVPAHSWKFAAALQAAQSGDEPILLRSQTNMGHGLTGVRMKDIGMSADVLAFFVKELKMRPIAPTATNAFTDQPGHDIRPF